ncbi:MAG: hypothetical protein P1U64_10725 [Alcanivoracaceae bacterium]|jgi:hypothetical protein|nr:hypothetical protein [Alcanivoracaceae bacterium]
MKKWVIALLLGAMATPAWAGDADDFVLGLYRLERCGFMSGSDYARSDRADICRDMLEETEEHLEVLAENQDAEMMDSVRDDWEFLRDVYDQALADPYMFRNHYTVDDIRRSRIAITETLSELLPTPPNPIALAVHVERMGAEYIWRAESAMGAGMSSTEVLDIEEMVQEADRQFAQLREKHPDDYSLRSAEAKYKFIRGSLLNYNVDMVPYLVDRYATAIVESLQVMNRM